MHINKMHKDIRTHIEVNTVLVLPLWLYNDAHQTEEDRPHNATGHVLHQCLTDRNSQIHLP